MRKSVYSLHRCLFPSLVESHFDALRLFFYPSLSLLLPDSRSILLPLCRHPLLLLHLLFIPYSFIWTRERMRPALGLITPSEGTREESSAYATVCGRIFGIPSPRETHRDHPPHLDCSWITNISSDGIAAPTALSGWTRWCEMNHIGQYQSSSFRIRRYFFRFRSPFRI